MNIDVYVNDNNISNFHVARLIFHELNYKPVQVYEQESYRLLYPINYIINKRNRSLTENQSYEKQLRFYTLDRIKRVLNTLVLSIKSRVKDNLKITIYHSKELDIGSKLFLDILIKNNIGSVTYKSNLLSTCMSSLDIVEEKVKKAFLSRDKNKIHNLALQFLSVGDAWTSIKLLNRILSIEISDEYFYDLGIAYSQIGETETAEFYLNQSKRYGNIKRVIDSNYVLAMLYARHHPKYLQSISKAEELLNEAYNAFQNNEPSFHKIFNRNGYALILYRKGKIEEAIGILLDGISKLQQSKLSDVDNGLHESVLTYNLAQCYVNLNMFEEASSAFEKLINMDPYYPENHLEYAKYLINNEKYNLAYKHLTYAKDLNPYIPETYSYLGLYYLSQDNQIQLAQENFKNAYILSNKSYEYLYDLIYTHTLENDYEKCYKLIKDHPYNLEDELIEDFYVNISIIKAECLLNIKSEEEAATVLKLALKKYPRNKLLLENEKILCKEIL